MFLGNGLRHNIHTHKARMPTRFHAMQSAFFSLSLLLLVFIHELKWYAEATFVWSLFSRVAFSLYLPHSKQEKKPPKRYKVQQHELFFFFCLVCVRRVVLSTKTCIRIGICTANEWMGSLRKTKIHAHKLLKHILEKTRARERTEENWRNGRHSINIYTHTHTYIQNRLC